MPIERTYAEQGKTEASLSERILTLLTTNRDKAYNLGDLKAALYGGAPVAVTVEEASKLFMIVSGVNGLIQKGKVVSRRVETPQGGFDTYYMAT